MKIHKPAEEIIDYKKSSLIRPKHDVRICPICNKKYLAYPAISRKDNKTEICPSCGIDEAILDLIKNSKNNKKFIY